MAINFEIGLRLTDKELKSQLAGINKDLTRAFTVKNADGGFSKEIAAAATQAKALDKALRAATTNKGISYAQLNMELAKAGTTAGKLTSTLAQGGTYFRQSLDQANNALALSNRHVLSLNKVLQEAARVFKQSFKFTVAQTAIRAISTEIRESVQWVTNLNDAVNNIAVVTGKTATQITAVTDQAIKGSKDLRIAAEDYAKGALIFYQQGLNDEEVIRRNEITIKAAKAANQSIDEMSKQLTAVWNTYGMVGDEQLRAASVGAKMAAQTAVDFSDIAQAMQTAAAPAAQMGVEYNQLAAIIATVGDTTQQSASIIGNAYKTIFSRFQQLVSDGTDGEVTLGSVSKKLSDLGVQIMNSDGTLKNLGQTINEVGNNWENWSQEQQLAIAQLVGGTRQYGQFLALMENFDKYQKNLQSAAGETGSTLEQQYTQALDSIESRAENAGEAWHRAFSNVITADEIKSAYGALEQVGTAVDNIIKGMGGLPGILSIVSVLLSSKIVPALQVAGKTALTLGASLIGKQGAMINRDFNRNAADIDSNAGLKNSEKEAALAKNEFSRQTAVINEQINSQLARATGLRRTELEMQREQLAATQQNFSATMSEAQALEQKLQNQLKIYQIEGDNVGNLEVQAQKERETVQLLEEQLRILQEQSKQKTIIKNDTRLGDDYKYQGTANERRAQNRAFIAQAQSKLDTARTNYGKTMDALDAAKIVEGNQKEEQSINKLVVAYGKLQSALSNYQKQKLAGKTDEAAKSMEQAKLAAADLAQGLQIVRDNGAMTDQEMTEFRNTLGTLDDNVDLTKVSDQLSSIGQAMSGMTTQGENAQQVLSSTQTRAVQTAQQLGEATGVIAQQQQEQAKAAALAAQYQKATLSEGISLTVQFASASVMALNSIKNMWDIYNNPDLSGGEKALQMITSMTSALMFTLPAFTAVVKKVQEFGRASILASVAQQKVTAGFTQEAAAAAGAAAAQEASGAAAMKAGLMAQTAWGPLLPVILAITAVVVGLAAAISFAASEAKNKSPEEQLKRAQAAAEQLAEAEQDARQKADDLRSAIEKYDSAVDTLNQCTKGTKEWEEALVEVNSQVSDILKKFPELLKEQDLFNKDGSLNRDVLDRAQQRADSLATSASAASLIGQANVENKKAAVATSDMADKYETHVSGNGVTYDYNRGHTDGTYSSVSADLEKVLQSYDNVGSKALELGDIYTILGNVTEDYAEDVLKLAQSHVDAAQMMENANKLIINEWADTNGEELATGQAELMAQKQQEYYDSFAEAFKQASDQNMKAHNVDHSTLGDAFKGTSFEGMSVTEAFNAARGTSYSLAGNGVRGTDSNRSYVYLENGEEKEYKLEEMQAAVAAAAALEKMGESAENAANILGNLSTNAGEKVGKGIQNYLTSGDFESMSQKDFESMQLGIEDAGGIKEYMQKVFNLTDEELTNILGIDYAEDFQTAVDNYATALDDFKSSLLYSAQKAFDDLDADKENLSVTGQKAIGQALNDAMVNGGKEAMGSVQKAFDSMDETNIEDFTNLVSGIDWSTTDAEDFIEKMKESGIETELTTQELYDFANALSTVGPKTFDELAEHYSKVQSIVKDLNFGDTISADDYKELGDIADGYFTRMLDGTYKMTGDAEKFYEAVQRQQISDFQNLKADLGDRQASLMGVQSYDIEKLKGGNFNEDDTYNPTILKQQLEYLEAMNYNAQELAKWKDDLFNDGDTAMNTQSLKDITEAINGYNTDGENGLAKELELITAQLYEVDLAIASSYTSFDDMTAAFERGEFSAQAYNQALFNLDQQLDIQDLDVEELEEYSDYLQEAAKNSDILSEELEDNEKAAKIVAKSTMKMNDGIDKLADGFEDWNDVLTNSSKESEEYAEAMSGVKDALSDVLDISEDYISADFVADNLDLIAQAATGDVEAIEALRDALSDAVVAQIILENDLDTEAQTTLFADIANLQTLLDSMDLKVGTSIDLENLQGDEAAFLEACNQIIRDANMTAEQANAFFDSMGFETNFATELQPQPQEVPEYVTETQDMGTHVETLEDGTKVSWVKTKTRTYQDGVYKAEGMMPAMAMTTSTDGSTEVPQINSIVKKPDANFSNYSPVNKGGGGPGKSSGKKGGGGKDTKTPEFKKQKKNRSGDEIKERYTNIDSAINNVAQTLEKLNDAEEDAWGAQKIRNLREINRQLGIQNRNGLVRLKQAREWLAYDQQQLESSEAAAALGINMSALVKYRDNGQIANREDIINYLYGTYVKPFEDSANALINDYNSKGVGNDEATEAISAANEELEEQKALVEEVIKLMDQVDDSSEEVFKTWQEILQRMREQVSNLVAQIQAKHEFRIAIDDRDLKTIENLLDRLGEAGVALGKDFDVLFEKANTIAQKLKDISTSFWESNGLIDQLKAAKEGGDLADGTRDKIKKFFGVNDEQLNEYLSGNGGMPREILEFMQELRDQAVDTGEELIDTGLEMTENMLTRIENWFDKTFGDADHIIELSEAKLDLVERLLEFKGTSTLTGAGQKANRDIMAGRMNVASTTLERNLAEKAARKDYVKELEKDMKVWENVMATAREGTLEYNNAAAQYNTLYEQREEALSAIQELETSIVEATTQILEVAAENIEKEKEIAKSNIATAINGLFSDISDMTNMYSMLQEEKTMRLDDYDKNYHLDRLQKKKDEAVEDLSPTQLEKIEEWQEKINKYKQDGVRMTQAEVDLLEKALEIEIARANFEDAQNAKNTMRLQRDASGNYSYVYSSDSSSTENEDKLAQLEFEYKKLLENTEDAFNESIINTAAKLQEEIENIDFQLYYSSELYRRSVDTKISSLLNQMQIGSDHAQQIFDILGSGVTGWEYDFAQSTAGILTNTSRVQEMFETFRDVLVGPNGYVPGSSDTDTYYGQIMEAQRYWAEVANKQLEQSTGQSFGLIEEHIKGSVEKIAGPDGYYNTLIIEGQRVGEITHGVLIDNEDGVSKSWNKAEENIHGVVGNSDSQDENQINGMLNKLKEKMTEVKNHQNTTFNNLLLNLGQHTIQWKNKFKEMTDAVQALIDKMKELEDAERNRIDQEPPVDFTDTTPTDPGPTTGGGPITTTPTGPSEPTGPSQPTSGGMPSLSRAEEVYKLINTGKLGNGINPGRIQEAAALGYTKQELLLGQALINARYPKSLKGMGYGWTDKAIQWAQTTGYQNLVNIWGAYTGGLFTEPALTKISEKGPELVLNAEDTKNILAAVAMMRQTVMGQFGGINGALSGVAGGISNIATSMTNNNTQAVDQQVRIEASFPGVSVAAEIEEAFNSLINQAAQYNIKK